jgi:hypothetical protein
MWEDEEEENSPKKFGTVTCHWAPSWQFRTSVFFIGEFVPIYFCERCSTDMEVNVDSYIRTYKYTNFFACILKM